jgi:hypothetical protein
MSRVLSSFLIGIGWDTTKLDEGSKRIESSMGAVKSTALLTGAAIASAAVAIGMAIGHNAVGIDKLNLSLEKLSSKRSDVLAVGTAVQLLGGDAGDAVSEFTNIAAELSKFRITGQLGAFEDLKFIQGAVSKELLSSRTEMEFYTRLQKVAVGLNKDQLIHLQNALGLSDASVKLLRSGNDEFTRRITQGDELNYQSEALNENARKYNESWETTKKLIGGVADSVTDKLLPGMNASLGVLNEFITKNKAAISEGAVAAFTFLKENATNPFMPVKATATLIGVGVDKIAETQVVKEAVLNANKMTPVIKAKEAYRTANELWHSQPMGTTPDSRGTGYVPITDNGMPDPRGSGYGPQSLSIAPSRIAAGESLANRIGDKVSSAVPSQQPRFVNEVNVRLDGRIIEQQVTEINARRTKSTLEDLRSTTVR